MALEMKLVAVRGPAGVTEVPLPEGELVIGRAGADARPDVPIPDGRVSRKHAVVRRTGDAVEIENFGANGTRVNGKEITKLALSGGEEIQISDVVFRLVIPRPAAAPADEDKTVLLDAKTVYEDRTEFSPAAGSGAAAGETVGGPPGPEAPPEPPRKSVMETMYAPPPEKPDKKGLFGGKKPAKGGPAASGPAAGAGAKETNAGAAAALSPGKPALPPMKPGKAGKAAKPGKPEKGGPEILPLPGAKRGRPERGAKKRPNLLIPAVLVIAVLAGAMIFMKPGGNGGDPFSGEAGPPPTAGAGGPGGEAPAGGAEIPGGETAGAGSPEGGAAPEVTVPDVKASLPGTADETLRRQAENDIRVGDDYYDESQVEWANLYKATVAWRRAQNTLGKFEVRPEYYPEIAKKIAKADAELAERTAYYTGEARRMYARWKNTGDRASFRQAYEHMNVIRLLIPETTDQRNKNASALMEKMRSAYERSE
jgi:pSer/pThr/pTyr-binding forkhead associated (FHA) protein